MTKQGKIPALFGLAAITAAAIAACGSAGPSTADYVGVCVDPHTGQRVADYRCGGTDPITGAALNAAFLWDYYPPTYVGVIPAYGARIAGPAATVHVVPRSSSSRTIVIDHGVSASGGRATQVRTRAASSHNQFVQRAPAARPAGKAGSKAGGKAGGKAGSKGIVRGGFGVGGSHGSSGS